MTSPLWRQSFCGELLQGAVRACGKPGLRRRPVDSYFRKRTLGRILSSRLWSDKRGRKCRPRLPRTSCPSGNRDRCRMGVCTFHFQNLPRVCTVSRSQSPCCRWLQPRDQRVRPQIRRTRRRVERTRAANVEERPRGGASCRHASGNRICYVERRGKELSVVPARARPPAHLSNPGVATLADEL